MKAIKFILICIVMTFSGCREETRVDLISITRLERSMLNTVVDSKSMKSGLFTKWSSGDFLCVRVRSELDLPSYLVENNLAISTSASFRDAPDADVILSSPFIYTNGYDVNLLASLKRQKTVGAVQSKGASEITPMVDASGRYLYDVIIFTSWADDLERPLVDQKEKGGQYYPKYDLYTRPRDIEIKLIVNGLFTAKVIGEFLVSSRTLENTLK